MRPVAKKILQWLVLLLCLAFIVRFFGTRRDDLRLLLNLSRVAVAALLVLHVVYFVLHGYRYQIVMEKCGGRPIGFGPWFHVFILGRFLNTMFPQAGTLYRAVHLKRDHQVSHTRYVSGLFSFAWMDTGLNLVVALVVIGWTDPGLRVGPLPAMYLVAGVTVLVAGVPMLADLVLRSTTIRVRFLAWLHARLAEVVRVSVQNLRDAVYLAKVASVGLVVFGHFCLILYIGFRSLGIRVGVGEVVLFYLLIKASTYVNVTPGNLGVLEIGCGILGAQMQIGMAEGMLVSAILRIIRYIALVGLAVPMGGLSVLRNRRQYQEADGQT